MAHLKIRDHLIKLFAILECLLARILVRGIYILGRTSWRIKSSSDV